MTTVYRVTALWTGFQGAPGYSRFSFQDLIDPTSRNAAGAAVRTMFNDLQAVFPDEVRINVQPTIQEYDMATGVLTGESSMTTTPGTAAGTAAGAYAAGAGFFVTWNTGVIFNGRRLKGRTFFVPAAACFDTDGSLDTTSLALIQTKANALVATAGANLCVWGKLWNTDVTPAVQIGGALAPADSATVKDQASSLRTRRT